MKHVTHWYGFTESDMDSLGRRLEAALSLSFEPRESSYLGEYLLDRSGRFAECQLYFNRDPLWQPDSDPSDEQYSKPRQVIATCSYHWTHLPSPLAR